MFSTSPDGRRRSKSEPSGNRGRYSFEVTAVDTQNPAKKTSAEVQSSTCKCTEGSGWSTAEQVDESKSAFRHETWDGLAAPELQSVKGVKKNDSGDTAESDGTGGATTATPLPPVYGSTVDVIYPVELEQCEAIDKKKVKTVLCVNYMHGRRCRYGSHCAFAHGERELRVLPPEMIQRKSESIKEQRHLEEADALVLPGERAAASTSTAAAARPAAKKRKCLLPIYSSAGAAAAANPVPAATIPLQQRTQQQKRQVSLQHLHVSQTPPPPPQLMPPGGSPAGFTTLHPSHQSAPALHGPNAPPDFYQSLVNPTSTLPTGGQGQSSPATTSTTMQASQRSRNRLKRGSLTNSIQCGMSSTVESVDGWKYGCQSRSDIIPNVSTTAPIDSTPHIGFATTKYGSEPNGSNTSPMNTFSLPTYTQAHKQQENQRLHQMNQTMPSISSEGMSSVSMNKLPHQQHNQLPPSLQCTSQANQPHAPPPPAQSLQPAQYGSQQQQQEQWNHYQWQQHHQQYQHQQQHQYNCQTALQQQHHQQQLQLQRQLNSSATQEYTQHAHHQPHQQCQVPYDNYHGAQTFQQGFGRSQWHTQQHQQPYVPNPIGAPQWQSAPFGSSQVPPSNISAMHPHNHHYHQHHQQQHHHQSSPPSHQQHSMQMTSYATSHMYAAGNIQRGEQPSFS